LKCHYLALGIRGLFLDAKARLLPTRNEALVCVAGIAHPIYLRLRTSDVPLFTQIILHSQYDWELSKPPGVIVDAGANIGLASIFYSNKYPNAKLICVEPAASNLRLLRMNMANYPNSSVVSGALWKENGYIGIVDPGMGEWGFQTTQEAVSCARARAFTVNSLMDLCEVDYIDLLKVDIEGAEKEVFENPSGWINRVGAIAIELHDALRNGCSRNFYSATKDFERESHKGETTFVSRAHRA